MSAVKLVLVFLHSLDTAVRCVFAKVGQTSATLQQTGCRQRVEIPDSVLTSAVRLRSHTVDLSAMKVDLTAVTAMGVCF